MSPFDFLFNESTKEWIWLPLWSAIVGLVLGWLFTWIVDGKSHSAKRRPTSKEFSAGRSSAQRRADVPPIRFEVSVAQRDPSTSSGVANALLFILTIFYIPYRVWFLDAFSIVAWVGWGFSVVVCICLSKRENWSNQPYGWVISGLVAGSVILFMGLSFVYEPPRVLSDVAAFSNGFRSFQPILNYLWIAAHLLGLLVLVYVTKAMIFFGLGTVARSSSEGSGFWSWLDNVTSRETIHPHGTFAFIVLAGIGGLLLTGGWGFEWFSDIWMAMQHLGQ
jgi:hypothetical protein